MTCRGYMDAEILKMKSEGLTQTAMAERFGVTRSVIAGRLWRIGAFPRLKRVRKTKTVERLNETWDARVFEPYAEFKARKNKERMEAK